MGKGDIRSKKGKRFAGSFGVSRPRKTEKVVLSTADKTEKTESKAAPKAAPKAASKKKSATAKTGAKTKTSGKKKTAKANS